MKPVHLLLSALILSFLTGCLEFNEVTQLRPDGGVDFTLTIQLPDFPDKKKENEKQKEAQRDIEEKFQAMAGTVELKKKEEKTEYGKTTFTLAASLDSLARIGQIYQGIAKAEAGKDKKQGKEGKEVFDEIFSKKNDFQVKKTGNGSLLITRSFSPPKKVKTKAEKTGKEEDFSKDMEAMMLNAMTFQFELFLPTEVIRSNATKVFGNNLRWDVSLGYLSENSFKMETEIKSTPELEAALLKK